MCRQGGWGIQVTFNHTLLLKKWVSRTCFINFDRSYLGNRTHALTCFCTVLWFLQINAVISAEWRDWTSLRWLLNEIYILEIPWKRWKCIFLGPIVWKLKHPLFYVNFATLHRVYIHGATVHPKNFEGPSSNRKTITTPAKQELGTQVWTYSGFSLIWLKIYIQIEKYR